MYFYFIVLFLGIMLYRSLNLGNMLSMIKYIKLLSSTFTPDKKASCEILRGNILKINYNDGNEDKEVLLPYSRMAKKWIRVTINEPVPKIKSKIDQSKIDKIRVRPETEPTINVETIIAETPLKQEVNAETSLEAGVKEVTINETIMNETIKDGTIKVSVGEEILPEEPKKKQFSVEECVDDIVKDIELAEADSSLRENNNRRKARKLQSGSVVINDTDEIIEQNIREEEKDNQIVEEDAEDDSPPDIDITREVLKLAGPGKDFFNLPLMPKNIHKKCYLMTFHYPKGENKSFRSFEIIKGL